MRFGLIIAGLACIAVALLSGCLTEELSETQRFLCIDLSSRPYAFVPECKNQEECFAKAEGEIFNFDSGVFSSAVQEELFYLKNNLALSWLYFNHARANLKEINKICSNRSGLIALALQVNELNNNLLRAFAYSDKANHYSFSVLLLEEHALANEKIELIKEEPLFSDFIAFNNNLNDLQSKNTEGETFASFYLAQMNSLQNLMLQTGFSKTFINEATPLDFFEKYQSEIIEQGGAKRVFEIPFVAPVLNSFISFLNDFFRLSSASDALAKMPALEFLQTYSNLAGTDNSAIQKFSELLKSDALHRKELLERNAGLESEVSEKLSAAEEKINALSEKEFVSFDQNFFTGLYSLLGQETGIATQRYSIQDFTNFREQAGAELLPLKTEFYGLRQQSALNNISIGEKTLALKGLLVKISFLLENLAFLESEVTGSLDVLCTERLEKIFGFLKETEFPNEMVLKTSDLKSRIKFKINEFKESKETEERLLLCKMAIEEFNDFKLAVKDFEEYSLKKELFVDGCFEYLETLFSSSKEAGIDLSDFALRFQKIKGLEEPFNDIETIAYYCSALKQDTQDYLGNTIEIISLEENFSSAKEFFQKLKLVDSYAERLVLDSLLESFESKFLRIEKYFSGNALDFEAALPVLPELSETIASLKNSIGEALDKAIADFVSKNAVIEYLPDSLLGTDFNSLVRINLYNPFQTTEKVLLKIPFSSKEPLFLPDNLSFSSGYLFADLNSLPLGTSFLEFFSGQKNDVNALAIIPETQNDFSELAEELIEEKNNVLQPTNELWEELVLLGLEDDFLQPHDFLLSLDTEIEKSLSQGDFNRTALLLDSLSKNSMEFISSAEASLKEKTASLSDRFDSFLELISDSIPEKLGLLSSVLDSVPDETLYGLGYISPVSKERLQKLELELNSIDSAELRTEFKEFSSLVSKKKFAEAIEKFSSFEKELEKKEIQANAINSELDSVLSTIKEDALTAVNSAASALNNNFNEEALELLSKAKNALGKKEFFKAIAFATAAEQLASQQNNALPVPVFFYPILAGLALVFVARYKKKQIREKKAEFKRILRNR